MHCQCADTSEKNWQNAKLRYNSVSYLQEAWIMLTRVLGQAKLLPMNGDKLWNGEALFSARGGGSHDRTFMDIFLTEAAQYLPTTPSNCIEWAPTMYMPRFPACASGKQFSLDFEPDINKMHIDANNHIHCDNVHLPQCMGQTRFDVALNTNVWEHEIEPFKAMESLFQVLKPGGVMLFTVPFVAPFHGVPYDFYRYTKSGVVHLLERAGFCVPKSRMASGGDFINDIALFGGVSPGDFSKTEIQQAYFRGYDSIPDGALVVMAVAYRKANVADACPA
jgi:SAM-dependent methyltransferase